MTAALRVTVTSRNLEKAVKAIRKGFVVTRRDLERLGDAGVKDARQSLRSGVDPDGRPHRRTKDGYQAYSGALAMRNAIRRVVTSDSSVAITSDDIRSRVANSGRRSGLRVNLKSPAIVPLSRKIAARVKKAGGWKNIRAFRVKFKNGNMFLAERKEGQRRLNLLGIFKKALKQYRRQHFGIGVNLRAEARTLGVRIVSRMVRQ